MIKLNKLITEIVYSFRETNSDISEEDNSVIEVEYEFSTPQNKYIVIFNSFRREIGHFDLLFKTKLNEVEIDPEYLNKTGEGKVYSIIETVSKIIEDFIYQYEGEKGGIKKIYIEGTDPKRKSVYKKLFPKYLPKEILDIVEIY